MPPKKYVMDELDKKFDEKLRSSNCDLVSDLKKEIMNDVKAILSEKEVTRYFIAKSCEYNKYTLDKKLMNWGSMEEGFASTLTVLTIKLTKNLRKFWEK